MRIADYCNIVDGGLVLHRNIQEYTRLNLVTDNPTMKRQFDMLERSVHSNIPLTIIGERGSGKDFIAQYAHTISDRRGRPFVKMNCAYLADVNLPMKLFDEGINGPPSILNRAAGGSLYLENLDHLTEYEQHRLMTHIQSIAGTPKDTHFIIGFDCLATSLCEMLSEPLYYHFSKMIFEVVPLRHRPEDILLLAMQQLKQVKAEYRIERLLAPNVMEEMLSYEWPNNTRQLTNVVERMCFLSDHRIIDSVPLLHKCLSIHKPFQPKISEPDAGSAAKTLKDIVQEYEITIINQYIERHGSLRKAAAALNVAPSVLSSKLTRYYASSSKNKLL